jgi:hypothetical protein
VSPRLEQLHYTWATRGVEGRNRLQIAAMSSGLRAGPSAPLLTVAKKICRYDPPRSRNDARPISYGWFDFRGHRVAFCRVGLESAMGRVGNFAAHVVVGSPDAMPASALAQRFESSFWWDGYVAADAAGSTGRRWEFQLPTIDLDEIPLGPLEQEPDDPRTVEGLANALLVLRKGRRLTVIEDSYVLGRHMRAIAGFCPQALVDISFSTYEGAATFPFTIVGAATAQPGREKFVPGDSVLDDLSSATLRRLRNADTSGELRSAATVAADGLPAHDARKAFWDCAQGIVAIATGVTASDSQLAVALSTTDGAAYIAHEPAGRKRIAHAIHAGDPGVSAVLASAASRLAPQDRTDLGKAAIDLYASTQQLGGCTEAARFMDQCVHGEGAQLLDVVLAIALADPAAAATLRPPDLVTLLVHTASRTDTSAVAPLLQHANSQAEQLAQDARIPDSYIATLFRQLLARDDATRTKTLTAVLARRPALLSGVELSAAELDPCLVLVEKLNGRGLEVALGSLILSLARPETAERLSELLALLPAVTAARLIIATARSAGDASTPTLGKLCDDYAADLLQQLLTAGPQYRSVSTLAMELLEVSRSVDHPRARQLLSSLSTSSRTSPLDVAMASADIVHPQLRAMLASLAIVRAVRQIGSPADVTAVWRELVRQGARPRTEDILRRLLQYVIRDPGSPGSEVLLSWMARHLLPKERRLLSVSGKMQPQELQTLSLDVASHVHPIQLEQREGELDDSDRRIKAWWHHLVAHSRRELRDSTRPRRRVRRTLYRS